jgi:hypothetical protein
MMRVAIDAWDPGYGSAVADAEALLPSSVPTDVDVEVPLARWSPLDADGDAMTWPSIVFVDGVQRVDARAWITGDDGRAYQGLCVSVGAGAVRCNGAADVLDVLVDRALVVPAEGAEHLVTRHGTWRLVPVASDDPLVLERAIGRLRAELEASLARRVSRPGEPIIVDGPLSQHRHLAGGVGYVKTLQRGYGPPEVLHVAGKLEPRQRTPLLLIGESVARWSWYMRLPGPVSHPLAGVVRCEAGGELPLADAVRLADSACRSLPRFASAPHKDTRAPQNLYPIAGLERQLRRRLGDPHLLLRALRSAAATPAA